MGWSTPTEGMSHEYAWKKQPPALPPSLLRCWDGKGTVCHLTALWCLFCFTEEAPQG